MACFRPLKGYRSASVNPSGKRGIVFNARHGFSDMPVDLPCGQCIGCRLERSRQWAIRCVHEAQSHERNCFITLTYNDNHLPPGGTLRMKDFQDFMKRLRFRFGPKIRFFHCGEYGDKFKRPHYHACVFNFDFEDKQLFKEERGSKLYISQSLEELWPWGFSTVGDVTFESAAYVARYVTKKVTGDQAEKHYEGRKPEYVTMSRRPGLGKSWFEKYTTDVYPSDEIVLRGKSMKPPKYYDRLFEIAYPSDFDKVKSQRRRTCKETQEKEGKIPYILGKIDRLKVKEMVQQARFKQLRRGYEDG